MISFDSFTDELVKLAGMARYLKDIVKSDGYLKSFSGLGANIAQDTINKHNYGRMAADSLKRSESGGALAKHWKRSALGSMLEGKSHQADRLSDIAKAGASKKPGSLREAQGRANIQKVKQLFNRS